MIKFIYLFTVIVEHAIFSTGFLSVLYLATFGLMKGQVRLWLGVSGAAAVQNVGSHFPLFSDEQRDEDWGL
jgi:hypothetical protein